MNNKQKGKETVLVCSSCSLTILGAISFIIGLSNLFELSITLACVTYTALAVHYYIRPLKNFK